MYLQVYQFNCIFSGSHTISSRMSFTGGQVSSQDGIVQCVQVYRHRMVSLTVIPCLQLTKGRLHDIHWLAWWWLCYSITVFNTPVCKQLVFMCSQLINKTITDRFCKIRKLLYIMYLRKMTLVLTSMPT